MLKQLDHIHENFCELLTPSSFTKEFAWTNHSIDIDQEYQKLLPQSSNQNQFAQDVSMFSEGVSNAQSKSSMIHQVSVNSDQYTIPGLVNLKASAALLQGNPLFFYLQVSLWVFILFPKTLYEKQPLWTIQALQEKLKTNPDASLRQMSSFSLKKALSKMCYLFKNGPFKFTYVHHSYDPRTDLESIKYQTFNIGVKNSNFLNGDSANANEGRYLG